MLFASNLKEQIRGPESLPQFCGKESGARKVSRNSAGRNPEPGPSPALLREGIRSPESLPQFCGKESGTRKVSRNSAGTNPGPGRSPANLRERIRSPESLLQTCRKNLTRSLAVPGSQTITPMSYFCPNYRIMAIFPDSETDPIVRR